MKFTNQVFEKRTILLDSHEFEGCTFDDCTLVICGIAPHLLVHTTIKKSRFVFARAAEIALATLSENYQREGTPREEVEKIIDGIKSGQFAARAMAGFSKLAIINFKRLVIDSQMLSSFEPKEDHAVSVITFDLEVDRDYFENLSVEVRHPFGTEFESEVMEVGKVNGYAGRPWNHNGFVELCDQYYRMGIGEAGAGIKILGGSKSTYVKNLTLEISWLAALTLPDA